VTQPCPADLESIVACLEVSAIFLSPKTASVFTRDQLIDGALNLMPSMERSDVAIVLDHYPTLTRRVPGGLAMR
jgi:hypothetical protein